MGRAKIHIAYAYAVVGCAACGRVGFDTGPQDAVSCAMASFAKERLSTFTDDFSSGVLTDRWSPVDPCIDEIGGELVATPALAGAYCHAWTHGTYHLTCDSVTVEVPEVTSSILGIQTLVYIHYPPDDKLTTLILEGDSLLLGTRDVVLGDVPYDPIQDLWWRLREADGRLFVDTSPDGLVFATRMSTPDPMPLDDVEIALGAGAYLPVTPAGRARFHCFNLAPPCS